MDLIDLISLASYRPRGRASTPHFDIPIRRVVCILFSYRLDRYCSMAPCDAPARTGSVEVTNRRVAAPLRVTERVDYALKAVLLLAQHPDDFLTTKAMAGHYGMSPKMLASVLWNLRSAEILESRPGWHGGFRLARRPQAIPVSSVIAAANSVDELMPPLHRQTQILPNSPTGEQSDQSAGLVDRFWRALDDQVQGTLTAFSVADLALARSLP